VVESLKEASQKGESESRRALSGSCSPFKIPKDPAASFRSILDLSHSDRHSTPALPDPSAPAQGYACTGKVFSGWAGEASAGSLGTRVIHQAPYLYKGLSFYHPIGLTSPFQLVFSAESPFDFLVEIAGVPATGKFTLIREVVAWLKALPNVHVVCILEPLEGGQYDVQGDTLDWSALLAVLGQAMKVRNPLH